MAGFTVAPEITVEPNSAAPGATIVVSGYLINGEEISVKFNGVTLGAARTDAATGYFELSAAVPGVSPGAYTIAAYWNSELQASAPFTVLLSPSITLTPSSGYPGDAVQVSGRSFAPKSHVTIYFDNTEVNRTSADGTGSFTAGFNVPYDAQPGAHAVTAIDDVYMAPAHSQFTVLSPPAAAVRPRSMMYYQGDWMSIYVNSTVQFYPGSEIAVEIYDAEGVPFAVHRISAGQIVKVGGYYVAPYSASVVNQVIPSDAEVGLWSWKATFRLVGDAAPRTALGQIVVAPRFALLSEVMNMLSSINSRLNSLENRADQIVALIADRGGAVIARIDSAENSIVGALTSGFEDVRTRLLSIRQLLGSAEAVLTEVRDGVARIETGVGTLYMRLEDLRGLVQGVGANITAVDGKLATIESASLEIKAQIEALNPKIERIDGGVAYISTALGNVSSTLEALNATVTGVVENASGEIIARIDTAAGKILAEINEVNATLSGLIVNSRSEVIMKVSTSLGTVAAKIDIVNATLTKVSGGVAEIRTSLGTLTADASLIKSILEKVNATLVDVRGDAAVVRAGVSSLLVNLADIGAVIGEVHNNTAAVKTAVGELKANVTDLMKTVSSSIVNLVSASTAEVKDAIAGARDAILARVDSLDANIYLDLKALNASLSGLIADSNGEVLAVLNTSLGTLYARLDEVNATLAAVDERGFKIQSLLGEAYLSVEDAHALLTDVWRTAAGENATIPQKIDRAAASLKAELLNALIPKIAEARMIAERSAESSEKTAEAASGLGIPLYATLALAAAAAATSILGMIEARRRQS
jgi:archaellum component FlaC